MKKKLILFISGRGSNMQSIIRESRDGILKDLAEVIMVFSDKENAPGLQIAEEKGIKTISLSPKGKTREEFDRELIKQLKQVDFDLIVLAGYMRILSPEFVQEFPKKIINIHPADTRFHQGLNGYKWAFENHLEETKITVHYVEEGLDTGEIIGQKTVDLSGVKSLEEVEKRGLEAEHRFYPEMIKKIITQQN